MKPLNCVVDRVITQGSVYVLIVNNRFVKMIGRLRARKSFGFHLGHKDAT